MERFFHYDSVPASTNVKVAEHVADVVWCVLLRLLHRDKTIERKPTITPPLTPQIGGSDCGVYVAFLTNAIILAGSCVDLSLVATPAAIRAYRGHMNVTLSRAREEYAQLRGETVVGKLVDPSLVRPGASKLANAPRAEDLEDVKGHMEDDVEGEIAQARAKRMAERAARTEREQAAAAAPPKPAPSRLAAARLAAGDGGGGGGGGGGAASP